MHTYVGPYMIKYCDCGSLYGQKLKSPINFRAYLWNLYWAPHERKEGCAAREPLALMNGRRQS